MGEIGFCTDLVNVKNQVVLELVRLVSVVFILCQRPVVFRTGYTGFCNVV